jgi:hypothetical protein
MQVSLVDSWSIFGEESGDVKLAGEQAESGDAEIQEESVSLFHFRQRTKA